jgi:hypothetical protein
VTQADYVVWKNNFGQTAGGGALSGGTVPEPETQVMLFTGMLAILCRRRTVDS